MKLVKKVLFVFLSRKVKSAFFIFMGIGFFSFWFSDVSAQEDSQAFDYFFFSTDKMERCEWDEASQQFNKNCNVIEASTLFRLNKDQTVFTHSTEEMQSTYYVESRDYDQEHDAMLYLVRSDVGNKYLFILDIDDDLMKVMPMSGQDKGAYLLLYNVKAAWKE